MKKEITEVQEIKEESIDAGEETSKKRKIVIPGEIIVSGEDYLPGEGARREGENVVASRFGLAEEAEGIRKILDRQP